MATKSINGTGDIKRELNNMNPAASHAKLGNMLESIISNQNAILAKLDAIGAAGSVAAINTAAGTTNVASLALVPPSQL